MGRDFRQIKLFSDVFLQIEQLFRAVLRPPDILPTTVGQSVKSLRLAVTGRMFKVQSRANRLRLSTKSRRKADAVDALAANSFLARN
jgi:hypothetical protein